MWYNKKNQSLAFCATKYGDKQIPESGFVCRLPAYFYLTKNLLLTTVDTSGVQDSSLSYVQLRI